MIRNLEVIGEASMRLPDDTRGHYPDVEWRKIAGLRDILAHQYFGIDATLLADVVANKLPGLKQSITSR